MSVHNERRRRLRQKLERNLFNFVKENDRLPYSTQLMKYSGVTYIQSRKFIIKKIRRHQWDKEKILEGKGKVPGHAKAVEKAETLPASKANDNDDKPAVEKAASVDVDQTLQWGPVTVNEDSSEDDEVNDDANADADADSKKEEKKEPEYVTRRAIRKMSEQDQTRFFDAVDTMLKAENGPGSSEFYRCASYHGQPSPIYCQHGRETFPGWHRIYLMDFEKALQIADKKNGNDGKIGLPYWDWTDHPEEGLPAMIRKRFNKWPDDLFPKNVTPKYQLKRDSDANITAKLKSWNTPQIAYDSLQATQHFAHSSTGWEHMSPYPSVEKSHNHLHVIVGGSGGTMASVAWAAYDIAFWLHHCNVDRVYESYLAIEPDSYEEFETTQERNKVDLFDKAFTPFKKANGEYYYPRDTFKIKEIGYDYDELIKPQPMQLREAPSLVLFRNVRVHEFESKCYQIHVYVVSKSKINDFKGPKTSSDIDVTSVNYAGGEGIFGRGMECKNCMSRPPVDLSVDISKTLRDLGISRYDAVIQVYIEETTDDSDELLTLDNTPLPQPIVTGPFFENNDSSLQESDEKCNVNEVRALQRFLHRFGYFSGEINGKYSAEMRVAVEDYQTAAGLKVDGVAGPKTKNSITDSRRCSNKDPFGHNDVKDVEVANKYGKKEISYAIGLSPGYLDRVRVEEVIMAAFKEWESYCGLKFVFVEQDDYEDDGKHSVEADILLNWTAGKREDKDSKMVGFDGAGGVLGHGGQGFVDFDESERWTYGMTDEDEKELSTLSDPKTWYRGQPTVSLYYVAVHEIGHSLGLDHSINTADIMGPYYSPKIKKLSANDVKRIQALYPQE